MQPPLAKIICTNAAWRGRRLLKYHSTLLIIIHNNLFLVFKQSQETQKTIDTAAMLVSRKDSFINKFWFTLVK